MGDGEVEIKAEEIIKPSERGWTGTILLSELDVLVAKVIVSMVYLYNKAGDDESWPDSGAISTALKSSLSRALVHYYPFTGRLRTICDGKRLELVVDDQDETTSGVPFREAYSPMEVAQFGDLFDAEQKGMFGNLFPPPSMEDGFIKPLEELPLLSVQITHFRCGGFAVGLSWSHAIVDGIGAGHFLSEWTRITRGESPGIAPIFDRSLVGVGEPPRFVFRFEQEVAPTRSAPPPLTIAVPTHNLILPLSKSQIDKLKETVAHLHVDGRPYSRFEVLTAHLWRSASKARGHQGTKQNVIAFGIDIRKRMNPPLPPNFNGNGILRLTATSESEDLNSQPLGYACAKIRETIEKVTDDLVWANIDCLKSQQNLWAWQDLKTPDGLSVIPDLMLTSWQNIGFNNLDFGWGNEAHFATPPMMMEGLVCIRSGQEEGSVVLLMCLQAAHVDMFKDYFFHQLN